MREAVLVMSLLLGPSLLAQSSEPPKAAGEPAPAKAPSESKPGDPGAPAAPDAGAPPAGAATAQPPFDPAAAVQHGCAILLEMQEGDPRREWPYEGVYREREPGQAGLVIPLAYR